MTWRIEVAAAEPDRGEMDAILRDYYALALGRLRADGGPDFSIDAAIEDFWAHLDAVLPPHGRLVLARRRGGRLVGCGTLATVAPGIGELKRLFVRPEARGTGLGRALVAARISAARDMGLSALLADTLRRNVEMQGLYAALGFRRLEGCEYSGTVQGFPELAPHLLFYRLDLGPRRPTQP